MDPAHAGVLRARHPRGANDSEGVHRAAIRAKALDTLRGLLPAATQSNVGLFGSGQAFESLLLRMRAHPLLEVRACADEMLVELRKVIPAFLTRLDQPDRGGRWSEYLADARRATDRLCEGLLREWPPTSARKSLSAISIRTARRRLSPPRSTHRLRCPTISCWRIARQMTPDVRAQVLRAYVGDRGNRRHRPGRAFERTAYRFDVLTDYGAFRDLQRHRLLTLEWQPLTTRHGYSEPAAMVEAGGQDAWRRVMDASAELHERLHASGHAPIAPYAVAMAYRVRFYMDMNAREAMHVIELRSAPQGHPAYRRVCQRMHTLIAEQAGHRAIAGAMQFADHSEVALERLNAERALEARRARSGGTAQ